MTRLVIAVLWFIALSCAVLAATVLAHLPVAVVCDRERPNVEVSSMVKGGYFEEHRVGPCVAYTHKSRALGAD